MPLIRKTGLPPLLLAILLIAFLLRVLWLGNNLFFGFEQGRDLLAVREISTGKISLIGPWTSLPGFFHGALSYWLLVPPFIISGGDPYIIMVLFILINVVAVVFFYKTIGKLFGKMTAAISILLLAVSYTSIVYARWLSNPTLAPASIIILFYGLIKAHKDSRFLVVAAIGFGVLFHLQVTAALILLPAILLTILLRGVKFSFVSILLSILTLSIIFSPYFVFDLRHDFIMSKSLSSYAKKTLTFSGGANDRAGALDEFYNEAIDNFFPNQRTVGMVTFFVVLTGTLVLLRNNKNIAIPLVFALAAGLFFFLAGSRPLRHYLMTTHLFMPVLAGIVISQLWKSKKLLGMALFLVIIVGNVSAIFTRLPENVGNFLYHAQRMYLGDEKRLIDYVYKDANGGPFGYDYYSIPYWKKEAWEYLFLWYGKTKYGYLPMEESTDIFYVLIEPDESQPLYQKNWYEGMEKNSVLLSSFSSGLLKVEKRSRK